MYLRRTLWASACRCPVYNTLSGVSSTFSHTVENGCILVHHVCGQSFGSLPLKSYHPFKSRSQSMVMSFMIHGIFCAAVYASYTVCTRPGVSRIQSETPHQSRPSIKILLTYQCRLCINDSSVSDFMPGLGHINRYLSMSFLGPSVGVNPASIITSYTFD